MDMNSNSPRVNSDTLKCFWAAHKLAKVEHKLAKNAAKLWITNGRIARMFKNFKKGW